MYEATLRIFSTNIFASITDVRELPDPGSNVPDGEGPRIGYNQLVTKFWAIEWSADHPFDFEAINDSKLTAQLDKAFCDSFYVCNDDGDHTLMPNFFSNVSTYATAYKEKYVPAVIRLLVAFQATLTKSNPEQARKLQLVARFKFYLKMMEKSQYYPPLPLLTPSAADAVYSILDSSRSVLIEVSSHYTTVRHTSTY